MRNAVRISGFLAAASVLAACTGGGGGGGPAPASPAAVTSASSATASPVAPSPSTPVRATPRSSPSAGASGAGRCTTPLLSAGLRAAGPAAGNRYAFLTLTNRSGVPCRVYGYVGLGLIGSGGVPLPTRVVRLAQRPPVSLMLRPGGGAYTRLRWSIVPGAGEPEHGPCRPVPRQVQVTPPDERSPLTIPWSLGEVCGSGTISVIPLTAGPAPG